MDIDKNMENVIEIRKLSKNYDGFSINNMNLSITKGSIHGFIGQNGAGKTTTIRAILNLISLEQAEITVFGKDYAKDEVSIKEYTGVVFAEMGFHDFMSPNQINTMLKHVYANWDETVFYDYLERFSIPRKKECGKFSRGMQMKLQIAVALSHHAKLLILDEPTSGLDPIVRNEILDIFQEFIEDEECTIFLSSHIISDLERIADEITFIDKGKILLSGNKMDILEEHGILKCGKEEEKLIDSGDIIFNRKTSFGCEMLIKTNKSTAGKYSGFLVEPATLEEIMLYYVQRENNRKTKEGEIC